MQLVFDFLTPSPQEKSGPKESSVVKAPIKNSRQSQAPTLVDQGGEQPATSSSILLHDKATHALELGGLQVAYRVVRVKRKTIAMLVSQEGLEVRAPRWVSIAQIQGALKEREFWILKQVQGMAKKADQAKRAAVQIENGCVSQVLGQGVQWVFSEEDTPLQRGHSTPKEKTLLAHQRENAKRLRSVHEHIQIQQRIHGEWRMCSWSEWCAALQKGDAFHVPKEPPDTVQNHEVYFRVVLPMASLLKKWMQDVKTGDARAERGELEALQKTIAKTWLDAVLVQLAREILPQRVIHFERLVGVTHTALTLGHAKQRWGSAGSNGAIRLNWHLVQVPMGLLDYVVAHELCHLKQMNHGPKFWAEMERVMPDYAARRRALKEVSMVQWV